MRGVFGHGSSVAVTTASTCLSVIDRGAPGRGSSKSPSSRLVRNLSRHLHTVAAVIFSRFATASLDSPAPHPNTIRARMAIACVDFGRAASISNFSFSSAVMFSGFVGRPVRIRQAYAEILIIPLIYNSGH
jgi:hypothetical protein